MIKTTLRATKEYAVLLVLLAAQRYSRYGGTELYIAYMHIYSMHRLAVIRTYTIYGQSRMMPQLETWGNVVLATVDHSQ